MIQDSSNTIASSLKRFFSGTLISRATGLVREIAMAAAFGTAPAVAAFWMAFRFAHLLRRLFGEGALHAAFVPHFESLRKEDSKKGARFFYDLSTAITLLLLFLTLAIEGILGACLLFGGINPSTQQVILLTMIFLPALVFISLYALNTSLLNCEQSYFLPSFAPAVLNLIWIGAIALLWKKPIDRSLEYLAIVIVFAFAFQWLVTVPRVYSFLSLELGKQWWQEKGFSGREILRIVRPFFLGMIGVAATQINTALDTLFARAADPEGPALLWYAIRIQQLPLALFGVGLTGAVLPPISRAIEKGDLSRYRYFLSYALKKVLYLMIPMTAALLALGFCGVNLVYGRGAFSSEAIVQTTLCLWAYGGGLFPMTAVLVLAAAFYGQKRYLTPTILSFLSVGLNIGLNAFFIYGLQLGAISVAFATSLTACINCALLSLFLPHKWGLLPPLIKVLGASACAFVATVLVGHALFQDNTWHLLMGDPLLPFSKGIGKQLIVFGGEGLCFTGTFFLSAYLIGMDGIRLGANEKKTRAFRDDLGN